MLQEFLDRPAKNWEFIERVQGRSGSARERVSATVRNALILRFSKVELGHLFIGTALVAAVGLSLIEYRIAWDFLAVFVSAFLVHELGHKFLAQLYRAWAEFRILLFGAAITAFSALPFTFKFIAPGAVFVGGSLSEGRHGRVSWIGPLTNLAMGSGFMVAHLLVSASPLDTPGSIFVLGAWFNGLIAVFNMIPFMGLDGSKIFAWNKVVWILTMATAVGLFVGADAMLGGRVTGFLDRWF
jgi:Zn-dependent protease